MSYLRSLAAEIRAKVPADIVPQDSDDLFLLYAVLARTKGIDVTAEDVHDAWSAWMELRGESHDALVPFAQLSPATRREDQPFVFAIRAVAAEQQST